MTERLLKVFGVLFFALILAACNGASGDNEEVDEGKPDQVITAITVDVLDANCAAVSGNAFTLGDTVCVRATLTQDGAPLNGEIITFNAGIGTLSVATKLTDSNGVAQVSMESSNANVGAAVLTATYGETVGSANYEFLSANATSPELSSITVNILNADGNPVTRFKADEEVLVQATLLSSDDAPIVDQIINFQSTSGNLSVTQALTNDEGIAQATLTPSQQELGAATISATYSVDSETASNSINYEVQSVDTVNDSIVRFGHFEDGVFVENTIGLGNAVSSDEVTISSGATLGVVVALVDENDQVITNSTPVTFTSRCVQEGSGTIDTQVNTINGTANATYRDLSCAGGTGNIDTITATININSTNVTITRDIILSPESVGTIEFVSASPENIVLQGTGGQGRETVSTVTFRVKGAQGNPLAQQTVNFSLNTDTGGLTLAPATAITNSEGQVSVKVNAGNVPTSVRVSAEVEVSDTQTLQTQSDLLSVNTGLPDQNSITLSPSNLNPEAFNINDAEVTIFASLADTFNNPVPDGTTVSFTAEGGRIDPTCNTTNGSCSVIWRSSNPKPDDHRVTILATAIGHETLVDSNGNNQYDDADGPAITDNDGSGFEVTLPTRSGFIDLSEAWRDDNENGMRDSNEIYLDFDASGDPEPNIQNGLFDGPQCAATNCGEPSIHVRRATVLVMSSSQALISVSNNGVELANNTSPAPGGSVLSIPRNETAVFEYTFSDTEIQPIASGSSIQVSSIAGTLAGVTNAIMPITNRDAASTFVFTLKNEETEPTDTTVTVLISSPSGVVSSLSFTVDLE
ncbi:Ig-like domain-containing protein [Glaciecola sp. MF2-115]|uniref:Ig-like domain-containing protein n=1 Tax=Glaciecola sp. MF2-115 TaxID=3384827 RepID=UPI0039A00DCE